MAGVAEKHAASYHLVRQLCSKTRRRTIETDRILMGHIGLLPTLLRRHELRGTNETIATRPGPQVKRPAPQ